MRAAVGVRKRLAQYSLRALLILMLVCAVAFGWLSIRRRAHEIVRRLRDEGAAISFAHHYAATTPAPSPLVSAGMRWARSIVGEYAFSTPVALSVPHALSPDALDSIRHLTKLQRVFLNNSNANDQTMAFICRSEELTTVYCGGTEITDDGIKALQNSPKVEAVVVWDTPISDASIKTLTSLPELTLLYLQETNVSDAGVAELASSGLRTQLRELDLSGTNVTGACLESVSRLQSLERLMLRHLPISEDRLLQLKDLTKLRHVDITGVPISKAVVDELRAVLPDCAIYPRDVDRS